MKIAILAGGSGTRLWPWSRESKPKQNLPVLGKKTLLEQTYKRFRKVLKPSDIFIITGKKYFLDAIKASPGLPRENIILEPTRKDTAGAIGLAAAKVYSKNPKEVLLSFHSDSWIGNEKKFISFVGSMYKTACRFSNDTILAGIKPTYPETGYGYIQAGKKIVQGGSCSVCLVKKFIEKPSLSRAKYFIKKDEYFWNPGWFAWNVEYLMSLYKKYLSSNYSVFKKISEAKPELFQKTIEREFPKLKSISIDYGILEKTKRSLVIPSTIPWGDLGHWRNIAEMSEKDAQGNVVETASVMLDSCNNFLVSKTGKCVASIGVKNTIMIETEDVILIADKSRAQDVKQIVSILSSKKSTKKYL